MMHSCHYPPPPPPKNRSKDVIKSGGEWISSITLENAAVGHPKVWAAQQGTAKIISLNRCHPLNTTSPRPTQPTETKPKPTQPQNQYNPNPNPNPTQVQEAAVIGVPHPKWDERPLLVVVPKAPARPDDALRRELLAFMAAHPDVARFAVPDDVLFVEAIPYGATGKVGRRVYLVVCWGGCLPGLVNELERGRVDKSAHNMPR
jgi:acyl-CoA synthetase (AMP-forming)/AMP-acid ligase II